MSQIFTRRKFLATSAAALAAPSMTSWAQTPHTTAPAESKEPVAFLLVGDTHYLANKEKAKELDTTSRGVTSKLIETLNRLSGTEISEAAGGGKVLAPKGLIHAGDLIDSGDKTGTLYSEMQQTEWSCFNDDFGLNGNDGRLKLPVYEIHGNHDSPGGAGLIIDQIKDRNKKRRGLTNVSENGLHYSWDWGGVHFVNLGIVVGGVPEVKHKRRYAPLDSLAFLKADLAKHATDQRPVVLTHHVDMARYSKPCDPMAAAANGEWDACDVQAYYEAIKESKIAAIMYGHTHVRNVYRWNGKPPAHEPTGLPVFNTAKVAHYASRTQAIMYIEISQNETVVREYVTKDAWESGEWTPQVWRVKFA